MKGVTDCGEGSCLESFPAFLVLSSQSPSGPAGGAPDGYGLGRAAAGPRGATSAAWAQAELHVRTGPGDAGSTSPARAELHCTHGPGLCLESLPILLSDLVRVHPGRPAALPTATGWDEELRARTAGVRLPRPGHSESSFTTDPSVREWSDWRT